MKKIENKNIKNTSISVPGSKSYSHRLLIASALSDGKSIVRNCLRSEDTMLTLEALKQMGVDVLDDKENFIINGTGGYLNSTDKPIYLANSGTSIRLLTGITAIGKGEYTLEGTKRMHERPIQDLLDGLSQLGITAISMNNNGCPPVLINGGHIKGGSMTIDCSLSSQYLSSVLLMAPFTDRGIDIHIKNDLVSKPYVDMTIDIMNKLGVSAEREGYKRFFVPGKQVYNNGDYTVEPDCSQASYFWGAAAITGKTVKVKDISKESRQGDVKFAEILGSMGCDIIHEKDGISVTGKKLKGIEVDMSNMPDVVPTLSVVAAFAQGTTIIKNVAHLKEKESNRIDSVVTELIKMDIDARATDDGLIINGGNPVGADIDTYDDHRIAMCFAISGLVVPGVVIKDEDCVKKSFPNYWEVFQELYEK